MRHNMATHSAESKHKTKHGHTHFKVAVQTFYFILFVYSRACKYCPIYFRLDFETNEARNVQTFLAVTVDISPIFCNALSMIVFENSLEDIHLFSLSLFQYARLLVMCK